MNGRSIRPRIGLLAVAVVGALLLSGCQIVSRVITAGPTGPGAPPSGDPPAATCVLLAVARSDDGEDLAETLQATSGVIIDRLTAMGVPLLAMTLVPPDQLVVSLPAGDDARWRSTMERTGELLFVPVPRGLEQQVVDGEPPPAGMDMTPIFDGSGIASATISADQLGKPAISLVLTPAAAIAFDAYAGTHFGERFAIVLDGVVISAPSINARRFNGEAQISGSFSAVDAQDLVAAITGGRLPTSVTEQAVTPAVAGTCPVPEAAP